MTDTLKKNILLAGDPGVGKSTLIIKLTKRFGNHAITGFYTEEVREEGTRVGFRAVTLNGSSAIFAHQDYHTEPGHRLGKYGIRPEILEKLVLPHLDISRKNAEIVFIDEIARMELISDPFKESVTRALDSPQPVIATVAARGTGFNKRVKDRADVEVITVTRKNRDILEEQVFRKVVRFLA